MRILLPLTLIALCATCLQAEPRLFPARNALALTVTGGGLVLEGADLVNTTLPPGYTHSIYYTSIQATQTRWTQGGYAFAIEGRRINQKYWPSYALGEGLLVYKGEELLVDQNIRLEFGSITERAQFYYVYAYLSELGYAKALSKVNPAFTTYPAYIQNIESVTGSVSEADGNMQEYAARISHQTVVSILE